MLSGQPQIKVQINAKKESVQPSVHRTCRCNQRFLSHCLMVFCGLQRPLHNLERPPEVLEGHHKNGKTLLAPLEAFLRHAEAMHGVGRPQKSYRT